MTARYRGHLICAVERNQKTGTYSLIGEDDELVAELKSHEFLSQPQLRVLANGRYRRTRQTVHGGPAGQSSSPWDQGTFDLSGITLSAFNFAIARSAWLAFREPEPVKPIENAGIRAGEIIAPRGWFVSPVGLLTSIYKREHVWRPGEPMTGDVRGEYGVHAFKAGAYLEQYIRSYRLHLAVIRAEREMMAQCGYGGAPMPPSVFAIGTVALWGEVIEHERGYRAEFAKIIAIDEVQGSSDPALILRDLREKYLPSLRVSASPLGLPSPDNQQQPRPT